MSSEVLAQLPFHLPQTQYQIAWYFSAPRPLTMEWSCGQACFREKRMVIPRSDSQITHPQPPIAKHIPKRDVVATKTNMECQV